MHRVGTIAIQFGIAQLFSTVKQATTYCLLLSGAEALRDHIQTLFHEVFLSFSKTICWVCCPRMTSAVP